MEQLREKKLSTSTEADLELLKECIAKAEKGTLVTTLNKFSFTNALAVNDYTTKEVTNSIYIANGLVHLDIKFLNKKDFGLKQVLAIYKQFLRENTKDLLEGREEALIFSVELGTVDEKKNLYYSVKFFNPFLCLSDVDDCIHMVFASDTMTYGKYDVKYEDLLNEIETENA